MYLKGVISFLRFSDGFSVKCNGVGDLGWSFSKTDGVPVGLVESQWGCPESQWGRLSMGMLQGVAFETEFNLNMTRRWRPKVVFKKTKQSAKLMRCN